MKHYQAAYPLLGEVEQLVLLAVLRLGDEAYAVPIRGLIKQEAGVEVSRGTVYVTLDRLERKGYLTSWFSDPQAVRGGKARRVFRLKPAGVAANRAAKRTIGGISVVRRRQKGPYQPFPAPAQWHRVTPHSLYVV
jgi:DNA-binding PadR family transcriptional regulator